MFEEKLLDLGAEGAAFFKNPGFEDAVIGLTDDGRVVYSYYRMISSAMKSEGWTEEEATEWINYNTLRSIPYMGEKAPVVVFYEEEFGA